MTEAENTIKSEAAIFWDEIANNLPDSLERSALGDKKIFTAFFAAYVNFRPILLARQAQALKERVEGELQVAGKNQSHICRFNDGEQTCDCYNAGVTAVLQAIEEIKQKE